MTWTSLGRDTRERLTAACRGEGVVPLLADQPVLQPATGAVVGLSLLSSVVLGGVLTAEVRACPSSGQSVVGLVAAAVLGAGVATQAVLMERSRWLRGRHSFLGGTYLFARDLIEVRGNSVRVVPTALLTRVEYVPGVSAHGQGLVELYFEDRERHELRCDEETGVALAEQIARLQAALDRASLSADLATLERLDPLWAERPRWDKEKAASPGRRLSRWLLSPWPSLVVTAVVGAAVGSGALHALSSESSDPERQVVLREVEPRTVSALESDETTLYLAMNSPANEALWLYLARGGHHDGTARQELLRRTLADNTLAALDDYRDRGGLPTVEIDEARHRLQQIEALAKLDRWELRAIVENPSQPTFLRHGARRELWKRLYPEDK